MIDLTRIQSPVAYNNGNTIKGTIPAGILGHVSVEVSRLNVCDDVVLQILVDGELFHSDLMNIPAHDEFAALARRAANPHAFDAEEVRLYRQRFVHAAAKNYLKK